MKRTFLARRNALLLSGRASWGSYALAFAVFVLVFRLLLPQVFWYVFTPAFTVANFLSEKSHTLFSSFGDRAVLEAKNEELSKQNALLMSENAALVKKDEELSGTSSLTGRIFAGVVSRPPESPYDTYLVSAGASEGVSVGMEAFAMRNESKTGTPLGIVSSVSAHYSRIVLFSSPSMTVNAWIGKNNVPVTLRGTGGGTFSASLSRTAKIAEQDLVYMSGPGMLPIGVISRIDSDPALPAVVLHITPLINPYSIGWVALKDVGGALKSSLTDTP